MLQVLFQEKYFPMDGNKMGNQKIPGENSSVEHSEATVEDLEGKTDPRFARADQDFHQKHLFFRVRERIRRDRPAQLGVGQHGKQRRQHQGAAHVDSGFQSGNPEGAEGRKPKASQRRDEKRRQQ